MINENNLNINELMNYGINYGIYVPINIHEMSFVFDSGKAKKEYYQFFSILAKKLNNEYKIPMLPIENFFNSGTVITYESSNIRKNFYFDYHNFMRYVLTYFMSNSDEDQNEIIEIITEHTIEEIKEEVNNKLKSIRKELSEIATKNEFNDFSKKHPNLFGDIIYDILKCSDKNTIDKLKQHKINPKVDMDIIINMAKKRLTDVIVNNKYLVREIVLGSTLNEDIFQKANKEKFLFYLAATTLNRCSQIDEIDPSIYFVINYYQHKIENGIPNISMGNTKSKYNFINFSKNLKAYLEKHPDIGMPKFKNNTFNNCTAEETKEYLLELSNNTLSNFDIVETDEVYIPNGENKTTKKTSYTKKEKINNTTEISKLTLMKRKFYSDNKDKIYVTLMGKNKFEGYIAHIFVNGFVIFEKHDKTSKNISNKYGAAYKMTIKNFNEFSKKSIPEIREYVKQNSNGDINYFCHSGNWVKRLQDIVDAPSSINNKELKKTLIQYKIKK